MAESAVLSGLLKVLFEKLASGTLQQLGKMLGVPRELEKLQSTLTTIQSVLQDAEEKEVKDATLRNWLEKLKNAAYDADDVLDEAHYELLWRSADIHRGIMNKVNDFFSTSHNPLFFRAKMARKVKDVVERLDAIAKERSNFHLRIDGAAAGEREPFEWRQTHSYVIESEVIERGEDKRRIIEMLLSHESSSSSNGGSSPRVLPIVGMGGLGKTTLAQMVYNDEEVTAHFELCMWVCVSDDFRIARLAKEIIESGGGGSVTGDSRLDQLQRKLRETIGSKRYLLVLDDVWNEDPQKWEELRVLLTFGGQGSTIIVTIRNDIVAMIVGTIGPYRLAHLSDDGCWELFENKAFPEGVGKRPELVQIGKKISERCKGLPLAAKVLGSMMHLKTDEREWMNVLSSEVWEMHDGKDGIIHVLKLSYDQLHPHLKQCFAFCAIFPKDHEIDKEYLIQLWMANCLIPTEGRLELEEKGDCIFKELASRSFFQDIKEVYIHIYETTRTTCKIHDLIHDLAQSIMGKECGVLNEEQLKRTSEVAIRYLVVAEDTIFSVVNDNTYKSQKSLRALVNLTYGHPTISIHIVPNLVLLRVLDLHAMEISKLPFSIGNLKHLRYLDLSNNDFEILPEAICQLFHLQTLKIEICERLLKLPKGMGNMRNLRHVYNEGCTKLNSMPRGLHKLSNLRTLTRFVASKEARSCGISELKDLDLGGKLELGQLENVMHGEDAKEAHLGLKTKIKSLDLVWDFLLILYDIYDPDNTASDNSAEEILEALQPHEGIQSLSIRYYRGQQTPSWMVRCHLLEELVIDHCKYMRDIPPLPSLSLLEVRGCPYLCSTDKGFFTRMNSLEKLVIDSADQLVLLLEREEDDHGDKEEWIAPLGVLEISYCWARMFSSSCLGMWKNLSTLHTLDLYDCNGLINLPDDLMRGLRSLKSLRIIKCENLTGGGIRRREEEEEGGLHLQHLTSLETLYISYCKALTSASLGEDLQRLRVLDTSCSKIYGLGGLTALRKLRIRYTVAQTISLPGLSSSELRKLSIWGCRELTTLPDEMGGLTLLEELDIHECLQLAALPMGLQQRLPHLKILRIWGCPQLETLLAPIGNHGSPNNFTARSFLLRALEVEDAELSNAYDPAE